MGTLYWFFYGTAFVVGLVEILAGELETGVTRFMAVSIKTFVLCALGLAKSVLLSGLWWITRGLSLIQGNLPLYMGG